MSKSTILSVLPDNIPDLLKRIHRWGVWATDGEKPGGRFGKVPVHPVTGVNTNPHSPNAWRDIETAINIYKGGKAGYRSVAGIFFDLPSEPEPIMEREDGTPLYLIGLDFDQCVTSECGKPFISQDVQDVLASLGGSYHEISPSGTGVRAFVTYSKPLKGGNKNNREMYSKGRFLTVTGHGSGKVVEAGEALEQFEQEWFGSSKRQEEKPTASQVRNPFENAGCGFELPASVGEGSRNATMLAYIGSLRGRGIPEDVLTLAARQANQERFRPPIDDDELKGLINRYAEQAKGEPEGAQIDPASWPDPKPIEFGLPEVPPFDLELLPNAYRSFVQDAAERMQCPADFIAAPLIVASAAALGNRVVVAPKARDIGWLVPVTLWGAIVARPGMMKSPVISMALKPLHALEKDMLQEHELRLRQHELEKLRYDVEKKSIESAIKKGNPINADAMPVAPSQPEPERLVTNDATAPKLAMLCAASPRGIINVRDELTGWMENLRAEGREADRAFYLEGWNGLNSFQVDRVGRGSDHIKTLNILMFGGIQPGKLQNYVRAATQGGAGDDGLMQRFQMLVWPDLPKDWKNVDRKPDIAAEDAVLEVFRKLRGVDTTVIGAKRGMDLESPAWLHFTDEAQESFDKWREKVELALRSGERHPAMESHLAKYRSLIPALSLLVHLIDGGTGPITKLALGRAIKWHKYLWAHARRVYASAKNSADLSAKSLADKIEAAKVRDGFTIRDVYRNGWANLTSREDATEAIAILIEHGWLCASRQETGGKPLETFLINPKINVKGG
ncbi:DUF3987 domain-containing protein [Thalassovita mediterranea]|uniref:Uncharacterized protein n=1 Tax=Thalassovita mediterranea TaxID=340021 RepID=A0A0P1GNW6_9RHOB|nr:DUF3987 domain-containing protein [Thalassovita mediterranea]CUH84157.1 hypothetical protein TM5383_01362 [Thalassovita mediterranea]SIS27631.1 Primase C terminal 1 (PriCT-1) [Thalassovita mediterranea]